MKTATWQGTITWFEIAKGELPPMQSNQSAGSETVLVFREDRLIASGRYYGNIDLWRHDGGNWEPTHWAFINLPK